ncbi:hypothetical protein DRN85_03965 [Methanosarcinales archaeon]|nr:MAG: hypothetical protein DRN85_03965 [Methanosarcinales archaeon]
MSFKHDKMADYAVFWGCTIQARFPFMEKSAKLVMDRLGARLCEIDGVTCCPTKMIKIGDEFAWYVTAARNLCLVENMGMDLVTPCNGCYSTLKSAASALNLNAELRSEVNQVLGSAGLEYKGTSKIKHLYLLEPMPSHQHHIMISIRLKISHNSSTP